MNAKGLFNELGFEQTKCINLDKKEHVQIVYEKIDRYGYVKIKIHFFDDSFYAELFYKENEKWEKVGGCAIYKELLEAINKQCDELWGD